MTVHLPRLFKWLVVGLIVTSAVVPASALFRFEWFYAGKPGVDLAGNLTSGMDADAKELWVIMYDAASPDDQRIHVFDAVKNEWVKTYSGGPEGVPMSTFRFLRIFGDNVWVGGPNGAAVLDRKTEKWKLYLPKDGLPARDVYSVELHGDEIWFGTNKGIGVLDGSGKWRYYNESNGLANNAVNFLLFDDDILWVCTEGGIDRLDTKTGQWKSFTTKDGLPGDSARRALVDGDNVWFAMKGGIARINRNTLEVKSYTMSDGLVSDEFKDIAILGKKIYFASNKGINYRDRLKEGKWKKITHKQGLPPRSDATDLAAQGDKLWIALWYEGLVRMSIPTGLAIIPPYVWIFVLGALGVAALFIIKPGAEKEEEVERKRKLEDRRRREKPQKPPYEICEGVPKKELCNRCPYNTLKAGKLYCSKFNKYIE